MSDPQPARLVAATVLRPDFDSYRISRDAAQPYVLCVGAVRRPVSGHIACLESIPVRRVDVKLTMRELAFAPCGPASPLARLLHWLARGFRRLWMRAEIPFQALNREFREFFLGALCMNDVSRIARNRIAQSGRRSRSLNRVLFAFGQRH